MKNVSRRTYSWLLLLAIISSLCSYSCNSVSSSERDSTPVPSATFSAVPTATSTRTATPTATASSTPIPTATHTPTTEPLRLTLNLDPVQVEQGHTLFVEVLSNRPIVVGGAFDERSLSFAMQSSGAWSVVGVPVTAEPGEHTLHLTIEDAMGAKVTTTAPVTVLNVAWGNEEINVPSDRASLLEAEAQARDAEQMERALGFVTARQYWKGAFIWPHAGDVTSTFGMGRTYNNGRTSYHGGIDLSGDVGAPVVAAANARVALAASLATHGNAVILDHGWGVFSGYYHLSEILVSEGQEVTQGELIGRVGNTGLSTGSHLHWEIRVGGVCVDPGEWINRQISE